MRRRDTLKLLTGLSVLVSGALKPVMVLAKWNEAAFTATKYDEAIRHFFPDQKLNKTDQIKISVHPVVENGAVVPVKIETDIQSPDSITIFADKNPNPLIANFDLSPKSLGLISTRIKVQESSNIVAVVKNSDGVFYTMTYIEVQEGGCG